MPCKKTLHPLDIAQLLGLVAADIGLCTISTRVIWSDTLACFKDVWLHAAGTIECVTACCPCQA